MPELTDEKPSTDVALKQESQDIIALAENLVIDGPGAYELAAEYGSAMATIIGKIEARFNPSCEKAHEAWKAATALRASFLDPFIDKEEGWVPRLKRKMSEWKLEQERKEREAEAKRQEQIKKEAAELEAKAKKAEAAGKTEKADVLKAQAQQTLYAPAPVAQSAVKSKNSTSGKKYKVVNIKFELLPDMFKIADEPKIRKHVGVHGLNHGIPGVEVIEDVQIGFKKAK